MFMFVFAFPSIFFANTFSFSLICVISKLQGFFCNLSFLSALLHLICHQRNSRTKKTNMMTKKGNVDKNVNCPATKESLSLAQRYWQALHWWFSKCDFAIVAIVVIFDFRGSRLSSSFFLLIFQLKAAIMLFRMWM